VTDHLSERFAALDADVSRHALIVASDRVRARGDRRRIGVAATSAIVLGLFATLSTVGVNMVGGPGNVVGNSPAPLAIPADLRLPHEGETGWQGGDNVAIPPGMFAGCGAGDPTLVGRTDRRLAFGPGWPEEQPHSPTWVSEQLILFDSDLAAKSAMVALVADFRACGWIEPGMGLQFDATQMFGKQPNAELERIVGIQTSNAVFLLMTTTTGALMSSAGTTELSLIAARLCTMLNLCHPIPGVSPLTEGSARSVSPPGQTPVR
jgi:hypothetical protein